MHPLVGDSAVSGQIAVSRRLRNYCQTGKTSYQPRTEAVWQRTDRSFDDRRKKNEIKLLIKLQRPDEEARLQKDAARGWMSQDVTADDERC